MIVLTCSESIRGAELAYKPGAGSFLVKSMDFSDTLEAVKETAPHSSRNVRSFSIEQRENKFGNGVSGCRVVPLVSEQSPNRKGEHLHPARSTVIVAQPVVAGWRAIAARFLCNAPSAPRRRAFPYRPGFEAVRGRPCLTSGLREQLPNQTRLW